MSEIIPSSTAPAQTAEQGPPRKIHWGIVVMWAAIAVLLATLAWGLLRANATRPEAGQPAPDFPITFFDGYEWEQQPAANLSDMRGKVVVLNFWASWCVECFLEAELIENTWRQYREQGVLFLGLAYADVEPKSLDYLRQFNITYPNAPDLGTDAADLYEITGVPETFFIDRSGTIRHVQIGPLSQETLDGILGQLVAEGG
jgi:cytochrome c biogenesis protein CcmG/thiol:disulfide interchange protein DsbE